MLTVSHYRYPHVHVHGSALYHLLYHTITIETLQQVTIFIRDLGSRILASTLAGIYWRRTKLNTTLQTPAYCLATDVCHTRARLVQTASNSLQGTCKSEFVLPIVARLNKRLTTSTRVLDYCYRFVTLPFTVTTLLTIDLQFKDSVCWNISLRQRYSAHRIAEFAHSRTNASRMRQIMARSLHPSYPSRHSRHTCDNAIELHGSMWGGNYHATLLLCLRSRKGVVVITIIPYEFRG